jgi:nitrite reductase/ring-hydroxylating ferredoxin subunit
VSAARPPRIARYERRVAGSLAGVWENVHDWEHLPWLHASSFRSIEALDAGDWGWRARVGLPPDPGGAEIEIELRRRPGEEAYDVTTRSGPGTGGVVATRLAAAGPEHTDVEVSFHVPGVGDDAAGALGAAYVALYTRLWDEDEGMIVARAAALATPPAPLRAPAHADLGPRDAFATPATFELAGRRFQAAEVGGRLVAWPAACPHRLGPLPAEPDGEGCVRCPWHGYRFDVRTGRSADGRALRLGPAPRLRIRDDGHVEAVLAPEPGTGAAP